MGTRLLTLSSQLSHCRTVLRLFDDVAMFIYTKQYGLGAEVTGRVGPYTLGNRCFMDLSRGNGAGQHFACFCEMISCSHLNLNEKIAYPFLCSKRLCD